MELDSSSGVGADSDLDTEANSALGSGPSSDLDLDASSDPDPVPATATWTTCWVQPAAPDSGLPAFCVCSRVDFESDAYIDRITLHAARGGPGDSWVLSMDLESVVNTIEYLYEAYERGHQIVTWGGRTFLAFFQQYALTPGQREHLRLVVEHHVDLEASLYVSGGSSRQTDMDRFLRGAISHPPAFSEFPYAEWWSGCRSRQMSAINAGTDYMAWLSTVWREVSGRYARDTGCASFGALCSGEAVSQAFGHAPAVSRRLSETMQDSFESFI